MNEWSKRRKRIIIILVFFVVLILIAVPAYLFFYRAPTCFDGRQNGDETGTDCGGSCKLLCTAESIPLILKGDPRVLEVTDSSYSIIALVENPNAGAEIYRAKYSIKLYNASSIAPSKIVEGSTFVPKGSVFAVFEGPFNLPNGESFPIKATLEWQSESLLWNKNDSFVPKIQVIEKRLSKEDTAPRVDALIGNTSLSNISNVDLVAILYNERGNIIASSKTFVENLTAGGTVPIVFSWPKPFKESVVNIEIIPRIFPDRSFIR